MFFFENAVKMVTIAQEKGLRLVMENPWSGQTYLKTNFVKRPDIVDNNRTLRGDYFVKPTAYWFFNCEPTKGFTLQEYKGVRKTIKQTPPNKDRGTCGTERSMISSDYARNWICDFVLGKDQNLDDLSLFSI